MSRFDFANFGSFLMATPSDYHKILEFKSTVKIDPLKLSFNMTFVQQTWFTNHIKVLQDFTILFWSKSASIAGNWDFVATF